MYNIVIHGEHGIAKCWIHNVELGDEAEQQILNVADLPFIFKHVAVMPDAHWGQGATVGTVIATKGAIVPAAVGVDLGCGMMARKLNGLKGRHLPSDLGPLRAEIEKRIPHGRSHNGKAASDIGGWKAEPPSLVLAKWRCIEPAFTEITAKHPVIAACNNLNHLGTLGTGNHFIELCLDENDDVWLMLHSGSRGVGNRIGSYFIERAKKHMDQWFVHLPDRDLAYLPERTEDFTDYCQAVEWAQNFASLNREIMMFIAMTAVEAVLEPPFDIGAVEDSECAVQCHHNYISRENHFGENVIVTRKGAISAREGQLGIIPGSMGARSYIVRGLGSRDAFNSCSHGAGRRMSRTQARRQFSVEDHCKATEGVECKKDESVIDETPGAYKDIDAVMAAQADLCEPVHTLKAVLCVKG